MLLSSQLCPLLQPFCPWRLLVGSNVALLFKICIHSDLKSFQCLHLRLFVHMRARECVCVILHLLSSTVKDQKTDGCVFWVTDLQHLRQLLFSLEQTQQSVFPQSFLLLCWMFVIEGKEQRLPALGSRVSPKNNRKAQEVKACGRGALSLSTPPTRGR